VSSQDHVATARDVFDIAAQYYVDHVGTALSPATEAPVDRSLLDAFVELVLRHDVRRVADVGCGPGRVAVFLADRGLDFIGVDVSHAMINIARAAHPHIEFQEGQLDALPIDSGTLSGVVSWYSIIYTPPDRLCESFEEFARVLRPEGYLLVGFQAEGVPVTREYALGTRLSLTSYRHGLHEVTSHLENAGFTIYCTALRASDLEHESTPQGFVIATSPRSS
jgi:ubiquinone/menaquinone biosynthesis C-methylase UbiE